MINLSFYTNLRTFDANLNKPITIQSKLVFSLSLNYKSYKTIIIIEKFQDISKMIACNMMQFPVFPE